MVTFGGRPTGRFVFGVLPDLGGRPTHFLTPILAWDLSEGGHDHAVVARLSQEGNFCWWKIEWERERPCCFPSGHV
jgi:hypothetical protein